MQDHHFNFEVLLLRIAFKFQTRILNSQVLFILFKSSMSKKLIGALTKASLRGVFLGKLVVFCDQSTHVPSLPFKKTSK